MQYRFLERKALALLGRRRGSAILLGGASAAFFGLGALVVLFGDSGKLPGGVWTYAGLFALALLMLLYGIALHRRFALAQRCAALFSAAQSGELSLAELAEKTGRKEKELASELALLLKTGCLTGCELRGGENPAVLLREEEN